MNSVVALPTPQTDETDAQLPARYEAAQRAIAECHQIDECKTWADKAAALASYARQAKDDSLRVMAVRIQARAERRCGELLKEVPRADVATRYGRAGAVPPVTRTQAAANAGLSERQRKTALRLASVPEEVFNRELESPAPPTVTQLADMGTTHFAPSTRAREEFLNQYARAREADGIEAPLLAITDFVRFCAENDPVALARGCALTDTALLRAQLAQAEQWLRSLADCLVD